MATVERHTVGGVPFIFQKYRSGWSIWYASMGGIGVPSGVGHPPPRGGWPTLDAAMMAAALIAADPHSKRFMTKNGGRMKRTSRRSKRTSRRNETVSSSLRFIAARKKKIQKIVDTASRGLHKLRMAGGPPLTIEEERRLDGIALDAAQTREQISGPHNRHEIGLQKRVAKALGYNY